MKIGIDAKWFFDGPPSGKMVVRNLVKHLVHSCKDHELYIFLNKRARAQEFPFFDSNVKLVYVWDGVNLLSNIFIVPLVGKKLGLDVFLSQNFSPLFSTFKRISFIHDVIFESHPEFFTLRERIYFSPLKMLSRRAHGVCTISNSEKERLVRYGYNIPDSIFVAYNGVDHNKFKPSFQQDKTLIERVISTYNLPSEFILYVGRLNVRKNIDNLLRSMRYLDNISTPLVLAGKYDWKMYNVEEKIKEYGLSDRVFPIGYIDDDLLGPLYSLAKILCYVSYDEGFGLPPLESMASGVPAVVANIEPVKEVCGKAGNYVNPNNPEEIASTIYNLLTDRELYLRKQTMGIERAKLFTWDRSVCSLIKCINSIAAPNYKTESGG